MKKLLKRFEAAMMAVAFAEAGEFETARELFKEERPRKTDRPSMRKRQGERPTLRAD